MPGAELSPQWKLLRTPRSKVNPFIASASTAGVAMGAVDQFRQAIGGGGVNRAAGSEHLQLRFAESAAEADAARLLIDRGLRETMSLVDEDLPIPQMLTARLLRDSAFVGLLSQRCVDRLHAAIGSVGIFDNHPLERALRDVHAGIAQLGVQWEPCARPYALLALGLQDSWNPIGFGSSPV
jgi:3-hydroxy-9,10-secoandrosta-1,3,5(10)-triene-9,17-dione monooxygenase